MRKKYIGALALLALLAATALTAGDSVNFGYNFAEGYEQAYKVTFNQAVDAGGFEVSVLVDMKVTERCIAVTEGGYQMEMAFDEVDASRTMMGNMQEDPMSQHLPGNTVTYMVDVNGKVTDLKSTGYIEGWEQSKDVVTQIVENWYSYMPNTEIAPGGDWKRDGDVEEREGMKFTTDGSYAFKEKAEEMGRKCALVEGKDKFTVSGETTTPMGTAKVDGNGEMKVKFYFATKESTIIKLKGEYNANMDLDMGTGQVTELVINATVEREII